MYSIELTVLVPLILGILILVLIANYFLSHYTDLELDASALFFDELLNVPSYKKSSDLFKEDYYGDISRRIYSPVHDDGSSIFMIRSVHSHSRIRRIWLLLSSVVYEGGVDYFNAEK